VFALNYVAASIAHFVPFETPGIDALFRYRFLTSSGHWAFITVLRMETVIYIAMELGSAMKPWADTNEDAATKPFWTVVARRGTRIRRNVIVTIGTLRCDPDFDADLSLCIGGGSREADCSNRSYQ